MSIEFFFIKNETDKQKGRPFRPPFPYVPRISLLDRQGYEAHFALGLHHAAERAQRRVFVEDRNADRYKRHELCRTG